MAGARALSLGRKDPRAFARSMSTKGNVQSYSALQKISHWTIAALCIIEFATADGIRKSHIGHAFGVKAPLLVQLRGAAHEWGGWFVFALAIGLLVSRVVQGAPPLPPDMPLWQRLLAHLALVAIYLGLFALVASGFAALHLSGRYAPLHIGLANWGIALIAIHVSAALWHQYIRKDHLLERMMPTRR